MHLAGDLKHSWFGAVLLHSFLGEWPVPVLRFAGSSVIPRAARDPDWLEQPPRYS